MQATRLQECLRLLYCVNQYELRHLSDKGEKWTYPLRSSACATQRALYRVFSRDPEVIPYRLPILLIKESTMS